MSIDPSLMKPSSEIKVDIEEQEDSVVSNVNWIGLRSHERNNVPSLFNDA